MCKPKSLQAKYKSIELPRGRKAFVAAATIILSNSRRKTVPRYKPCCHASQKNLTDNFREDIKYYFADFVRKGGGGSPQIRNHFFAENFVRKGGGGVSPWIRNPFLDKKNRFFLG